MKNINKTLKSYTFLIVLVFTLLIYLGVRTPLKTHYAKSKWVKATHLAESHLKAENYSTAKEEFFRAVRLTDKLIELQPHKMSDYQKSKEDLLSYYMLCQVHLGESTEALESLRQIKNRMNDDTLRLFYTGIFYNQDKTNAAIQQLRAIQETEAFNAEEKKLWVNLNQKLDDN